MQDRDAGSGGASGTPRPSACARRQILDAIERNGYNNFTKRAYVPKWRKYVSLPLGYARGKLPPARRGRQPARPQLLLPPRRRGAAE